MGLNVFEDWSKQPKPIPAGPRSYENVEPIKDQQKEQPKPTGDDKLKTKGLLQAWLDS